MDVDKPLEKEKCMGATDKLSKMHRPSDQTKRKKILRLLLNLLLKYKYILVDR